MHSTEESFKALGISIFAESKLRRRFINSTNSEASAENLKIAKSWIQKKIKRISLLSLGYP